MLKKQERLKGVKQRLVDVVLLACTFVPFDVQLSEGVRTAARQKELYAIGRPGGPPGPKVTWTLDSKHITGDAVDIYPLQPDASIDFKDDKSFSQLASAMIAASRQLNIKVKNGGDWDMDEVYGEKGESDKPHWELA